MCWFGRISFLATIEVGACAFDGYRGLSVQLCRVRSACGGLLDRRSGISDRWFVVAGGLEGLGAHVALGDGPFVGLLGEQATDEADYRSPGRENPHHVGSGTGLPVQT